MVTSPPNQFAPGFEFLQNLIQNTSAALPNMGQWIAPTLNPQELQKRIDELKVVQFWLEQNSRMLAATVQALEVQRMTLSTLQEMNVPLADVKSAMHIPSPGAEAGAGASTTADPLQWWSALTQQFGQLAAQAMKEGAEPSAPTAPPRAKTAPPPTPPVVRKKTSRKRAPDQ
jgi:hypothetical protein